MALNPADLREEIIQQMKKFSSLSKTKDINGKDIDIDLESSMGDFALAIATAVINHIKQNAVVDTDAKTVS